MFQKKIDELTLITPLSREQLLDELSKIMGGKNHKKIMPTSVMVIIGVHYFSNTPIRKHNHTAPIHL